MAQISMPKRGKGKERHALGEVEDDLQLDHMYRTDKSASSAIHKVGFGKRTKTNDIRNNSTKIGFKRIYFCNSKNDGYTKADRLSHKFAERNEAGLKIFIVDAFGEHSETCNPVQNAMKNNTKYVIKEVVKENADRNEKIIDIYNEKINEAGYEE